MNRGAFMWSLAALAGIVVTAALTWSASRFAGEHVGISSAPLSITSGLAPRRAATAPYPHSAKSSTRPATTTQAAPTISLTSTATITSPAPSSAPATGATNSVPAAPAPSRPRDESGGGSGQGSGRDD